MATEVVYCACCGGEPDDKNLIEYQEHCYQCAWRYHDEKFATGERQWPPK